MTFNTGNNVPSTDPRDLYDNAENLDKLVNGAEPFYADRLGKLRESWAGMENDFDTAQEGRETTFTLSQADKESRFQAFLVSSGYVSKGDYAADVVLEERNEYVAVDAATTGTSAGLYRPNASATLPLTLTGTWATDKASLVLLGDDVLRQELAAASGAALVAGGVVIQRRTVADLLAMDTTNLLPSAQVLVAEYHEGTGVGGGVFRWSEELGEWATDGPRRASRFGLHASQTAEYNTEKFLELLASNSEVVIDCSFQINPGVLVENLENVKITFEGNEKIIIPVEVDYAGSSITFRYCNNIRLYNVNMEKPDHETSNVQFHLTFIGCKGSLAIGGHLKGGGIFCLPDGNSSTPASVFPEDVKVLYVNITNPRYGINLSNVTEYEISGCVIRNPRLHNAPAGEGADGIKVTFGPGVSTAQVGALPTHNGRGLVTKNLVVLEDTPDSDDCMDLYSGGRELIVSDNICIGGQEGIVIKSDSIAYDLHQRITVSGAILKGQTERCLRITLENANSQSDINVSDITCVESRTISEAINLRGKGINATNLNISSDIVGGYEGGIRLQGVDIHLSNFNVKNSKSYGLVAVALNDSTIVGGSVTDCCSENDAVFDKAGVRLTGGSNIKVFGVSVHNVGGGMTHGFHSRGSTGVSLIGCSAEVTDAPVAFSGSNATQLRVAESSLTQYANSWNAKELEKSITTVDATATSLLDYYLGGQPAGKYSVTAEIGASGGATGLYGKAGIFSWDGSTFDALPLLADIHADLESASSMNAELTSSSSTQSIQVMVTGLSGVTIAWKGRVKLQRVG